MKRTWCSLPDQEIFAVAGVWSPTAEWGEAYSMVMADVHDRMPTILVREDRSRWTTGRLRKPSSCAGSGKGR